MDCLTNMSRGSFKRINNNYYKDNKYSTTTTTTTTTAGKSKISKLGRAVLMVEIGLTDAKTTLQRPSGAPKTSQRRPQNPPKAIFGSKRRANQAQESSKMNLEALLGRFRSPSDLPRAFQELPNRSPGESQNDCKTIFGSKTFISPTC